MPLQLNKDKFERQMMIKLFTNEQLAKKAGLSANSISKIRNGSPPRATSLKKICEALECTPKDLI